MKTFYQLLGISELATETEVRNAFREKSKQLHPDCGGSTEEFQKLNEAYQVLSDPQRRAQYDMKLKYVQYADTPSSPQYDSQAGQESTSTFPVFVHILLYLVFYSVVYFGLMKMCELLNLKMLAYFIYFFIVYCTAFRPAKD